MDALTVPDEAAHKVVIRELGQVEYQPTWRAMQAFTSKRTITTPDELWALEHPPVFTQGQAGKAEHLLAPGDIPVIQVDRGGQVTYHGPGQLTVYLLVNLRRKKMGARDLVTLIEDSVVATLADLDITAAPRPDAPGVYTNNRKIASLGLRIRNGCSFHGLSLNVDMDLEPFERINPCGYQGLKMTQISDFMTNPDIKSIQSRLIQHLTDKLRYNELSYCSTPYCP